MSGDGALMSLFRKGGEDVDVYKQMSALVLGKRVEDVTGDGAFF